MSTINDRATVTVEVNSQTAEDNLLRLRKKVSALKDALTEAKRVGDMQAVKFNTKALREAQREVQAFESSAEHVSQVMKNLDRISLTELKRTINSLKKDIKEMDRTSPDWDKKVKQLNSLQTELGRINRQLNDSRSGWQKAAATVNQWYYSIQSAAQTVSGIVTGMRSSIQAYADMDSAMANTQKFTGMTREEVNELNEAFKQMDTRTSREGLNELAAAAGRLGKNSVEDVLGFVRAGDQIGVAMDELGQDAPQIISQLAGIFGLEGSMGTEKAMLSVGSAINTLSQNCSASAPNLVDFASRMGAMANSTNMTMDQMLAFGAVLDSNRVSIEKGATAVQTVLNKMLADPASFAQKAGLGVDEFTAALKRSSTEGLTMFIERLSQLDQNGVAATLANLGVSGSGVTTTFVTLANKIEDVHTQLNAANLAFTSATSVTEEAATQNSTVQAQLDKAKESFHELAVALGEKLAPMALSAFSSLQTMTKVLIEVVNFVAEHKTTILNLSAAVAAYTVAVNAAAIKTAILAAKTATVKAIQTAWTVAVTACRVAMTFLAGGIKAAKTAMDGLNTSMKSNILGAIASLIAVVVAALTNYVKGLIDERTAAAAAAKVHQEYLKSLTDISSAAADYASKEITRLKSLYDAATNENLSRKERIASAKELQSIYPEYFGNMSAEQIMLGQGKASYDALTKSIIQMARAKAAAAKIEQNEAEILDLEAKLEQQQADDSAASTRYTRAKKRAATAREPKESSTMNIMLSGEAMTASQKENITSADAEVSAAGADWDEKHRAMRYTERQIKERENANAKLTEKYGTATIASSSSSPQTATTSVPTSTTSGKGGTPKPSSSGNKFAADESWAEQERLNNAVAYSTGLIDYQKYADRIDEIDKGLLDKKTSAQ